jgi:hypothetical protein
MPLESFLKDWQLHNTTNVHVFVPDYWDNLFTFSAFAVMIHNSRFGIGWSFRKESAQMEHFTASLVNTIGTIRINLVSGMVRILEKVGGVGRAWTSHNLSIKIGFLYHLPKHIMSSCLHKLT